MIASLMSVGLIVGLTSAAAEPPDSAPVEATSQHVATAESSVSADLRNLEEHDGSLTIREPGTVVDAMYIRGAINVRADDVTIKNSVVAYSGYHSIRVFSGADGTRILNTDVYCLAPHTNGVVFGNYYAEDVALHDCRNDFMSSAGNPAQIVNSTVDGVPFESGSDSDWSLPSPEPKPEVEPSEEPTSEPSQESTSEPSQEPTSQPSQEPTSQPSQEPTSEPSQVPTSQPSEEAPEFSGFPDASNTGVPAGTDLRSSGSLKITEDGTVIDGLHVRGTITIEANNVTIRNTLVAGGGNGYPIRLTSGTRGTLIEHVEVDNQNSTGIGIFFNGGSGTVRYANIHSAEDGVRIEADNATVEYSYIHDMHRVEGGHHDSIQIRRGDNITLRGNNLQAYVASTGDPMNAALQIGSLSGNDRISNLVVEGNLMNGGNYTINGGGDIVDSATYLDNQFGRDFRYGIVQGVRSGWWDASNVWQDTAKPVGSR